MVGGREEAHGVETRWSVVSKEEGAKGKSMASDGGNPCRGGAQWLIVHRKETQRNLDGGNLNGRQREGSPWGKSTVVGNM